VSVGNSGGEIIISATGGGAADGGVGISAGANSVSNGTVVFSNSNGISFGLNASTVTASYTVPTQSNQSIGIYAVSNTTGASSSSTVDARSLSFQGAGIASVGMTNGSVVISVPAGGGAGDGYNILAAGTQTANTTGTVVFSNSNNVTFGMSNSSVITASADAGSVNFLEVGAPVAFGQITHSTLWLQRINQPYRMTATVADILLAVSNSASAGWTGSVSFGIYGIDASTLNMLSSSTRTIGYNSTAAASSYTAMSATRFLSIPVSFQMTPGQYVLGMIWDTVSSATSGSHSFAVNRSLITVQQEPFAGGNRTRGFAHGVFTAATGAFPSTIHLTNIAQSSNVALRQPYVMLAGTF
jgi:hypothetical protein